MQTIWKFPLKVTGIQQVEMPKGATILCADTQGDVLCLWAIVDPDADRENRQIAIVGTGHGMAESELKYIGTAQMLWHVFEVIK
jgi:hypothetical protein